MEGINLFKFQENCSDFILKKTFTSKKKGIIVKSPTGSGKTIILIDYIDKIFNEKNNLVVLWFCPGIGNLEEQSKTKMEKLLPTRSSKSLNDVLTDGFKAGDTVFINWEQINKKNNKAITETEKSNLFDKRDSAIREGLNFIVIIDEEHRNKKSSRDVITAFNAYYTVRVSATTRENDKFDWYEIDEVDVINAGLITKAIYINESVYEGEVEDENKLLLQLADDKRKAIKQSYERLGLNINPLVIIQFPDNSESLINNVENILESMGYMYDNKMVSKWLSDSKDKINLDNISANNGQQAFILIKQAVATGWDCPRAKILVKLRENMNDDFQIQTIGRIRRMPEAKHYEVELLDNSYLYTFDEEFTLKVKQATSDAYECKHIYLKNKCKIFTIKKENRDDDIGDIGVKEAYEAIYGYYKEKLKLQTSIKANKVILEKLGYDLSKTINSNILKGKAIITDRAGDINEIITTTRKVSTTTDGFLLMQTINSLKAIIHCDYETTSKILIKLFRKKTNSGKILKLNTNDYYAFVINNYKLLQFHFDESMAHLATKMKLVITKKISSITLPEVETLLYDSSIKSVNTMMTNAYNNYTDDCLFYPNRTKPERLFERYCEKNDNVDWVYKNGNKGQEYFSIVYYKGYVQSLFYPDYIVKLKDGTIWIIEAKGGEKNNGESSNVDKYAEAKFHELKNYANINNMKFGFVRNKIIKDEEQLFINNTFYTEEMGVEWKPLNIETAF